MDGVLQCSRYAFGPNRLHYCGSDANQELLAYIKTNTEDFGLTKLLEGFQTLYPYLQLIAHANNIKDPFDERVVEAYWIGNSLLDAVEKQQLYKHLKYKKQIDKHLGMKPFRQVEEKIVQGAVPHHSFHVFSIWKRTGHTEWEHTLESIDACRISSGVVKKIDGPFLEIDREPLVYSNGKFSFGDSESIKVMRSFEADINMEELKVGDIITLHWGVPCESITKAQASQLKKYTLKHLALANQTL